MIVPYLHFQESCRAAMEFYHEILGGELSLHEYGDAPEAPESWIASGLIMHASLHSPRYGTLMASDFAPGEAGEAQQAVSLSLQVDDPDEGFTLFEALSQGGEILTPYDATFFSPGFGACRDMFGCQWIVSTASEAP